ncbi:hypothetical protein PYCCODRAFT_1455196 [Trametes coccinea BRFM310]|uniref:Fe2OG dioxygenase domain-containing protein n=1 Tax=Trametes coccinea (strain BRFM310) TaxID=1353009 RepID=A0A1Y2IAA3_TRAC3|nr:hypothetical protein PYCCODRAFT_1455196 [Trametes coccinea BRFM310]
MFDPASDSEDYDAHERQLGPNPSLSLMSHSRAEDLRRTLDETMPYCCGTLRPASSSLTLYYGKTEQARRIDLLHASTHALSDLERYCDPATFGVSQQNVLDLAYRKAGKLDRDHFAFDFDIERSGLLEVVRMGMFTGKSQKQRIRAELYKLNIYGKGCFFKSHKDTPRSTAMFASLVLIFPTAHSGGELLIAHGGRKWSFDAASVLSDTNTSDPRLAYVAFFSDVEHEVTRVTSGHRLSITYNLYYAYDDICMDRLEVIQPRGANASEVHDLLNSLLDDHSFLPNGGVLGFGLRHLYPLPTHFDAHDDKTLNILKDKLKGIDAALFQACTELLDTSPTLYTPPVWEKLCRQWNGVLINAPPKVLETAGPGCIRHWTVHWVTPLSDVNRVKTRFAAYGNEPMMGYLYQRICLLIQVGSPGRRKGSVSQL